MSPDDRPTQTVFVIMPFTETPTRGESALTEFFQTNLKGRLEADTTLRFRYVVKRSADTLDINAQLLRDLYSADVVLCDLSGYAANPNVMYELGVRLAVSNQPVILFRESHPNNRRIFDIHGFYTEEYDPTQYRKLEEYILRKLRRFETGEERYHSPVLTALRTAPRVIEEVNRERIISILSALRLGIAGQLRNLGGIMHVFMTENDVGLVVPDVFTEQFEWFRANSDPLQRVHWERLPFYPGQIPAMWAVLSDLPLLSMFPTAPDLASAIQFYIQEYYTHFYSVDRPWRDLTHPTIHNFVGESSNLIQLLEDVVRALATGAHDESISTLRASVALMLQNSTFQLPPLLARSKD